VAEESGAQSSLESSPYALVDDARGRWSKRPPAYRWVLPRPTSYRRPLPRPGEDVWWDVLEVVAGALALLSDRRCWTGKDVRAARGFVDWSKRKGVWRKAPEKHGCDARNAGAVQWTGLGALERAAHDPDGLAVQLSLEVARRAARGRPLPLVEELEGWRGMMGVLRKVLERARKAADGWERKRRRRRKRRSETRVSDRSKRAA
jgi:hypothetical protein